MKRAQSMGINVVIIAAIALLVLIIITVIVARGGISLTRGVESCESQGGRCTPGQSPDPFDDRWQLGDGSCPDNNVCWEYSFG